MKHPELIALAAAAVFAIPAPAFATDVSVGGYETIDSSGHTVTTKNTTGIEYTIDSKDGTWTDSDGVTHNADEYAIKIPKTSVYSEQKASAAPGEINKSSDAYTIYIQGFIPSTKQMIVKADTDVVLSSKDSSDTLTAHTYMVDNGKATEYSDTSYRVISADELAAGTEENGKYVIKGAPITDKVVVEGKASKGSYTGNITYRVDCVDVQ